MNDTDDMGLAKDHKLQREIDRENRDSAINRAMAEADGSNLRYLGGWWVEIGPGVWGRTEDELPNYLADLNVVHEVIYKLGINDRNNLKIRVKFITCVRNVVSRRIPTNKVGASLISDVDLLTVKSNEFCEAILKTLNKWNPEWDYPI